MKRIDELVRTVSQDLKRRGYARLDDEFFGGQQDDLKDARFAFAQSCRELPLDEHCGDDNRHRRYHNMVFFPWSEELKPVPALWDRERARFITRYFQSQSINPEQGGTARSFAPLTEAQMDNAFLRHAVIGTFRCLDWPDMHLPVWVGLHIIQLRAKLGAPGVSSPDRIHRDGEPYTLAALVSREGVVGGENLITVPEVANQHPRDVGNNAIIERFTLERPWEGWVVDDKKVAHYVSPIELADGYDAGHRTILLIDFTRMVPDIEH